MNWNLTKEELKLLQCTRCKDLLKSPVYLRTEDGKELCGKCVQQGETVIRNKVYEILAKHMQIPCKFKKNGCLKQVIFSDGDNQANHEENCEYKLHDCPIAKPNCCSWRGSWKNLPSHCKLKHSDKILPNPNIMMHQLDQQSHSKSFLVPFENRLFLLCVKICIITGKIYHRVKLLGDQTNVSHFKFRLGIQRDDVRLYKCGNITSENAVDDFLITSFSNILEFFDNYDSIFFSITIINLLDNTKVPCNFCGIKGNCVNVCISCKKAVINSEEDDKQVIKAQLDAQIIVLPTEQLLPNEKVVPTSEKRCKDCGDLSEIEICLNCRKCKYCSSDENVLIKSRICGNCQKKIAYCKNSSKGCSYKALPEKIYTHELYFCLQSDKCDFCDANISEKLLTHYTKAHSIYLPTEKITMNRNIYEYGDCLIKTELGLFVCECHLTADRLEINLCSDFPLLKLQNYSCSVHLYYPNNNAEIAVFPKLLTNPPFDWNVVFLKKDAIHPWSDVFDIQILINKSNV